MSIKKILNDLKIIPTFVKKELKLIKAQKISVLLILLLPLLVELSLGMAFGNNQSPTTNVVLLINPTISVEGLDKEEIISMIAERPYINVIEVYNQEEFFRYLKAGHAKMGIQINSKNKIGQLLVDVYFDNSDPVTIGFLEPNVKTALQLTGIEISNLVLSNVWSSFEPLKEEIDSQIIIVESYLNKRQSIDTKLNSIETKLNSIPIEQFKDYVNTQKISITEMEKELSEGNNYITEIHTKIDQTLTEIQTTKKELANFNYEIEEEKNKLENYRIKIITLKNTLIQLKNSPNSSESDKVYLQRLIDEATILENDLQNSIIKLNQIQINLNAANDKLTTIYVELANSKTELSLMQQKLVQYSSKLRSMNYELTDFEIQLTETEELIQEMADLVQTAKYFEGDIYSKLEETKEMLLNLKENLSKLDYLSPVFLSNPIIGTSKMIFPELASSSYLIPMSIIINLILSMLLLTSMGVIKERKEGIEERIQLSSINKTIPLIGKIIGQLLIALLISTIMLLVAIIFFKLEILCAIWELYFAILLISLSFISLGLIVAQLVKNEGSAILFSLLLIIPMLFMSGMLAPLELMNPTISQFASIMPMTLAKNILTTIMLKGVSINFMGIELAYLFVFSVIVCAIKLFLEKRK